MRAARFAPFLVALAVACSSGSGTAPTSTTYAGGSFAVCNKIAALPCSSYSSAAECNQALSESKQQAQNVGCTSEFNAELNCVAAHPITCDANGKEALDPACLSAIEAYAKCDPSAVCVSGGSNDSCSYDCNTSAMSCQSDGTTWTCTCSKGTKLNQTFTSSESNPCQRSTFTAHCQ